MGELKRSDIIEDDALMAPLVLSENFEVLLATIKKLKTEVGKSSELAESATTISGVGTAIESLVAQEKELAKVQNQLSSAVAKDNAEYAELKKKVDAANQSVKTRIQLGDREATTINKTNASLRELGAALTKNRQEYAKLASEQERSSAQGKKLLSTIQLQDKEFKELNATLGQHQANVGNYAGNLNKANVAAATLTPTLHAMGSAIWNGVKAAAAFIATPLGLFLAGIGLLLSPIIAYFTSTAEGVDRVDVATAEWNARLQVLKDKLADLGKEMTKNAQATDESEEATRKHFSTSGSLLEIFYKLFPAMKAVREEQELAAKTAGELTKTLDELGEAEAKYGVEVAELELQQQRLILQAKNRTLSEDERIEKLNEAVKLEEQIKNKRIEFADQELEATVNEAAARLGVENKIDQSLTGQARVEPYRNFAKQLIDIGREKDDAISDGLIESLKKQTDAEKQSVVIEEKVSKLRDELTDKKLQRYEKERLAKEKATHDMIKLEEELHQAEIDFRMTQMKAQAELLAKAEAQEKAFIAGITKRNNDRKARENKDHKDKLKKLEEEKEAFRIMLETQLFYYQEYSQAIAGISGGFTARRIQGIDSEIAKLEMQTAREIELAGDNEARKQEIFDQADARRAQLEAKRRAELKKQATLEKAFAITEAFIRTRMAVLLQLKSEPAITAIPRSIAAGVLGALQIAAIAARPLPQFYKGTQSSPEGPAIVGEQGRELKIEKSGKIGLTPGVPTIDNLKAGTKIIPHKETMKILALSGLGTDVLLQRQQNESIELNKQLSKIEKNTRSKGSGNLFRQGSLVYEALVKEDGSKKLIRRSNLGY